MGGCRLDAEHASPTGTVHGLRESRYRGLPARTSVCLRQAWSAEGNDRMRKATDTTLRNLAMLSCIPVCPNAKSTKRILQELRELDPDYDVSERTVQRDLDQLSGRFPISCEARGRANHWFWTDPHALTQIPSMSAPTAFALRLAAEYLRPIMPPSTRGLLEAYFNHADSVLEGTALGRWTDKAVIVARGPVLTPPSVPVEVQETVYTALMESRKVEVAYRAKARTRARQMVLNPLGIVVRAGIISDRSPSAARRRHERRNTMIFL